MTEQIATVTAARVASGFDDHPTIREAEQRRNAIHHRCRIGKITLKQADRAV